MEMDIRWKQRFQKFKAAMLQLRYAACDVMNPNNLEKEEITHAYLEEILEMEYELIVNDYFPLLDDLQSTMEQLTVILERQQTKIPLNIN